MKTFVYALDLKDDTVIIEEYERLHQPGNAWPDVLQAIRDSGIIEMRIFRTGNRLFMIMETLDGFDPQVKADIDAANEAVQEWEKLMWQYQQRLPWAQPNQKWVPLQEIFTLSQI